MRRHRAQRNWGARVHEVTLLGIDAVVLENAALRVTVLAGKGSDVDRVQLQAARPRLRAAEPGRDPGSAHAVGRRGRSRGGVHGELPGRLAGGPAQRRGAERARRRQLRPARRGRARAVGPRDRARRRGRRHGRVRGRAAHRPAAPGQAALASTRPRPSCGSRRRSSTRATSRSTSCGATTSRSAGRSWRRHPARDAASSRRRSAARRASIDYLSGSATRALHDPRRPRRAARQLGRAHDAVPVGLAGARRDARVPVVGPAAHRRPRAVQLPPHRRARRGRPQRQPRCASGLARRATSTSSQPCWKEAHATDHR